MGKIPNQSHFFKTNKELVKTLGPFEAILLAYVAEFNDKQLPCFASRKHISAETGFAEKTIQNLIKKLVKSGHLILAYEGRKRILTLPTGGGTKCSDQGGIRCSERGYNIPPEGVRNTQMRGHEILNTKIIDTKINNTKINLLSSDIIFNDVIGGTMNKETEAGKKRRLHLKSLWDDPTNWNDEGNVLTKWDETYQTLLRKPKPVHAGKSWNGKIDYSDLLN